MITPQNALQAWKGTNNLQDTGTLQVQATESGLINQTFWLKRHGTTLGVLQRLNSTIFDPRVNLDIAAVTAHLQKQDIITPTPHGDGRGRATLARPGRVVLESPILRW